MRSDCAEVKMEIKEEFVEVPLYQSELKREPVTTVIKSEALKSLEETFSDCDANWESAGVASSEPTYEEAREESLEETRMNVDDEEVESTTKTKEPTKSVTKHDEKLEIWKLPYKKIGSLYCCELCDRKFKEKRYVCDHLAAKHSVGSISESKARALQFVACEVCGKLVRRQYMIYHVESIHEQVVKAECDICGMKLYNKTRMQSHITSHILPRNRAQQFQCDICQTLFTSSASHKTHIKNTHQLFERNFICNYCGATFKLARNLRQHVKHVHTLALERKACKYCGKEFSMSTVKKHEAKVHEKEFKYVCKYKGCDKKFYLKDRLARHINSFHLKLKPFVCTFPGCTMAFGLKDVLDVHYGLKHLKLRETCPIDGCKYSVGRRHYMRMHLKKHPELTGEDLNRYGIIINEMNLLP